MNNARTLKSLVVSARSQLRPIRRRFDIAVCKNKVRHLPPNQSIAEIVDFALKERAIGAQQVASEFLEFAALVAEWKPKTILEIGTSRGGSLFAICRLAAHDATIISIDLPGAGFGEAYTASHADLFRQFPAKQQSLTLIAGDSHSPETRKRVETLMSGIRLDLLFIDGDHSFEGAKKDFEMYSGLVAEGGVIAFHDIALHTKFAGCNVRRFWNEVKLQFRHKEIVADEKQGWAGIGILWKRIY